MDFFYCFNNSMRRLQKCFNRFKNCKRKKSIKWISTQWSVMQQSFMFSCANVDAPIIRPRDSLQLDRDVRKPRVFVEDFSLIKFCTILWPTFDNEESRDLKLSEIVCFVWLSHSTNFFFDFQPGFLFQWNCLLGDYLIAEAKVFSLKRMFRVRSLNIFEWSFL